MMAYFAQKAGQGERIYLHAEVLALLRSRGRIVHKVVVERFNAEGEPLLAKPCPCCSEALKAYGVKEVEYTSTEGYIKERVSNE